MYPAQLRRLAGDAPGGHWVLTASRLLLSLSGREAIATLLERLGQQAGADRAWVFDYAEDGLSYRNSHEWSAPGIVSFLNELQCVSVGMIGWLHAALMRGQVVMVPDAKHLPTTAAPLRAELRRQNSRAVLAVPIIDREQCTVGALGFDMVGRPHRWSDGEIAALFDCAGLIGLARAVVRCPLVPGPGASPPLFLHLGDRVRCIAAKDMVALRSARDCVRVWLTDGSEVLDRRPISIWAGMLPATWFQRIHRTGIVNLHHVLELNRRAGHRGERWELHLRTLRSPWSVSRPYRSALRGRLGV